MSSTRKKHGYDSRVEAVEGDSVKTRQSVAKAAMFMVCKCCMQFTLVMVSTGNILSCAIT